MLTYTQFRDDISNLLFLGWNTGDSTLSEYKEITEYLIFEKNNLCVEDTGDFMGQFKIAINVVSSYCFYIEYKVNKIDKNNVNFDQVVYIHFCIGDITSKISTFDEIKMSFVFDSNQSSKIIVKALIILSQLPFKDDESRKQFNKIVKFYQETCDAHDTLKEVKLDRPESCYIATMAYGDYNHPQVIYLRQYRDKKLLPYVAGKLFVKLYYTTSPYLVPILKNSTYINRCIKMLLDYWILKNKRKIIPVHDNT